MDPRTAVDIIDASGRLIVVLLAGYLVWTLRKPLGTLFTRKGSEFSAFGVTVKVGEDPSVPLQNVADELRHDVNDLMGKVGNLQEWQRSSLQRPSLTKEVPLDRKPTRLLWVDDVPENNVALTENLRGLGVTVIQARSTREGLRLLQEHEQDQEPFDVVITDMGRREHGRDNPTAGLELTRKIRELERTGKIRDHPHPLPVIVYASTRGAESARESKDPKVSFATASPVELLTALRVIAADLESKPLDKT
jgi:CheY-like chemotaxis protein